jgi:AcrR family transcriptional regulator
MPGYAFGSKAALYGAVLERSFAVPRSMVGGIPAALESGDPAEVFAGMVEAYIDFLAAHPRYVRLLQRAALDGGLAGGAPVHLDALEVAIAGLRRIQGVEGLRGVDPRQLVVSVLGLCFFPFAHRDTLLVPLGLDAGDPVFLAELKAHVVDLLLHGLIRR